MSFLDRWNEDDMYHLLAYTEGTQIKLRKFATKGGLHAFVTKFKKKHPDPERSGDNWIDYVVYDVKGEIKIHDPSNWLVD